MKTTMIWIESHPNSDSAVALEAVGGGRFERTPDAARLGTRRIESVRAERAAGVVWRGRRGGLFAPEPIR